MSSEREKLRGVVLAEDKRTERFFRELLDVLGFKKRSFRFETAPPGQGSAEAWVANRFPDEVRVLRSKRFQQSLRLIAVRDGDGNAVVRRKQQLDAALQRADLLVRQADEGIATPVPTRNIETWLLALLGTDPIDETTDYKHRFVNEHGTCEKRALRDAAAAWNSVDDTSLHSLLDGKTEIERLDP